MNIDNWLLFAQDGSDVVVFTSILSTEVTRPGSAVSHPVEMNSFLSYNKLQGPLNLSVTLGVAGDSRLQTVTLDALDRLQKAPGKLIFATPAAMYSDLTLASYSYTRSLEKGAGMLVVTLTLVEVREVESLSGTVLEPRYATSSNRISTGSTQTKDVTDLVRSLLGA